MYIHRENNVSYAELEKVEVSQSVSFKVGKYESAFFERPWHYHPEFELLLITKGYGMRMVGDHFEKFEEGDLVLLGANLPHAWISDQAFMNDDNDETCESIFIQFKKSVFGTNFIEIPELKSIRTILHKSERGVKVTGKDKEYIVSVMKNIAYQKPIEQLLLLIKMLDVIYNTEYEVLASGHYHQRQIFKNDKMTKVHNYIMRNFKEELSIEECAEQVGMTVTSFCRFFKKHTNVTFSVYVNYLRINLAQKYILNTDMAIKEIAFECGFISIAYFNQVFKKLTGVSPLAFKKKQVRSTQV